MLARVGERLTGKLIYLNLKIRSERDGDEKMFGRAIVRSVV